MIVIITYLINMYIFIHTQFQSNNTNIISCNMITENSFTIFAADPLTLEKYPTRGRTN